jgi:putative transcriptional regulator
MDSLKGQLLISGGGLFDASFRHTVVLVGDHGDWGAVGVVLNRRLEITVGEGVPALSDLAGAGEYLFRGGPVDRDRAVLLAEVANPGVLDVPVFESVGFLTGDVPAHVRSVVRRVRVYLGHSGWGPGQLEAELEGGSWIVEAATTAYVFTAEPAALWRHVLERKGAPYATLARIPFDPSMN